MTQTLEYKSRRSELFWDALRCVSGPIRDSAEVAAIVQIMDACGDVAALEGVGRRVAATPLADCDRAALRGWYRECRERLRKVGECQENTGFEVVPSSPRVRYWTDGNRPASSAQRYFLVKHGAWVDGLRREDAALAIRRVAKDMRART